MHRRTFLATALAASALPLAAQAEMATYTPGLVARELAAGKTVFLDFAASWCTTCAAQERAIKALWDENPDYLAQIAFIRVDWDDYARDDLTVSLAIPRRSTLVVLKGDAELGRIVAGTRREDIKALMDTALAAAGS